MAFIIYTFFDLSTVIRILQAYLNLINPKFFAKKTSIKCRLWLASSFCSQKLIDLSILHYFQ